MDMKFEAMNKITKLESFMNTVEQQYVANDTWKVDHSKLIKLKLDFDNQMQAIDMSKFQALDVMKQSMENVVTDFNLIKMDLSQKANDLDV